MPKPGASKAFAAQPAPDPRFASFTTDPRFRLPSKKASRTKIDKRFSRMLKDDDFANTATVDRYGRKLSSSGKKKALEKLYVPDEEEEEEEEEDEAEAEGVQVEVEDDEVVEKELLRAEGYDPARQGGFSSSDDDDEDEDEDVEEEVEEEAEFPDMQAESAGVEMGDISSRFAVVNLDWDNLKSTDLMAVFSSFVPVGGKILKVSIYPSDFGKERADREELEGPPKEIFTKKDEDEEEEIDSEDSEDDEEEDERIRKDLQKADAGEEFDASSLRKYQLERLRYYYAVVECSSSEVAQTIYEATDGTEYLASANFFDLRFIPDGTDFDDKPRDECTAVPAGYRPLEFVTDALQHSKVKLTWDMNPEEASRKDAINRAFSGSRAEIGENDLRAYLGSDSESEAEEEAEEAAPEAAEEEDPKLSKKDLQRQKMRAALGLADEPAPKSKTKAPVGSMEITFTSGLSTKPSTSTSVFDNEPIIEETTAEHYVRLQKDRKARRKERSKARREGRDPDAAVDDTATAQEKEKEDLGFDDPFFATDEATKTTAAKSLRKEARMAKRATKDAEAAASASQKASLALLLDDDTAAGVAASSHIDHFDINEIARTEKNRRKKKKGKKGGDDDLGDGEDESKRGGLQRTFEMDVSDARFGKVFGDHEFAIDPSHPRFKGTEGMKMLLEEGRRKRGAGEGDEGGDDNEGGDMADEGRGGGRGERVRKRRKGNGEGDGEGMGKGKTDDLSRLVERVKRKARN